MTMTHYYSICNSLLLLATYDEETGVICYRYSDEEEVKTSPIYHSEELGYYFKTDEGCKYSFRDFCRIDM